MNLSMLDREQLEDILLNPPRVEVHPLQCSDSITLDCLPTGPAERSTRIRHVLAAAHELLVRSAMRSASSWWLPGSNSRPASVPSTISANPPVRATIVGAPAAMPSSATMPNGS